MKRKTHHILGNKCGFTIAEVIISLALIGIIAVGVLPIFSTQLSMTIRTRGVTQGSFERQGELETSIQKVQAKLQEPGTQNTDIIQTSKSVFGRTVEVQRVSVPNPKDASRPFTVYLSETLAQNQAGNPLVMDYVQLDASTSTSTLPMSNVEAVSVASTSTLVELVASFKIQDPAPTQDLNLYNWYRSKVGISNPIFPEDYEPIPQLRNSKTASKKQLKDYAQNRYVILAMIPSDQRGLRGDQKESQRVYIQGEEWRAGLFAWIDKPISSILDGLYNAVDPKNDFELKDNGVSWVLLSTFDTERPISNPDMPEAPLDGTGGALYVPQRVREAELGVFVNNAQTTHWTVMSSIHFANRIFSTTTTPIQLVSKESDVHLYQFVELDAAGKVATDSTGRVKLKNQGATLSANGSGAGGDLIITAEKGNLFLEPYTNLTASEYITLSAYDTMLLDQATVSAGVVSFVHTNDKENKDGSGISIRNSTISASELHVNNNAQLIGGTFNGTLTVADGVKLYLSPYKSEGTSGTVTKINNGTFNLQNTGTVVFKEAVDGTLTNPLKINLSKLNDSQVKISTNYGRNVGYASGKDYEIVAHESVAQPLGQGTTNLAYRVEKISGDGIVNLAYAFDGTDTISIKAEAVAMSAEDAQGNTYTNSYNLYIVDQYASGVVGMIPFTVTATNNGTPHVEVGDQAVEQITIALDANLGQFDDGSSGYEYKMEAGGVFNPSSLPTRKGYELAGWNTQRYGGGRTVNAGDRISQDTTLYAQWKKLKAYTITFDPNYAGATIEMRTVWENDKIALPMLERPGYGLVGWNMQQDGKGRAVTNDEKPTSDMTIYAQWIANPVRVTFKANGGMGSDVVRDIPKGSPIGNLPIFTRNGYVLSGFNTAANGSGTSITEGSLVSADMTVYAQWGRPFSMINVGDYVKIGDNTYQKVSDNQLLLRDALEYYSWFMGRYYYYSESWSAANSRAINFKQNNDNTNFPSYVLSSDLLSYNVAKNLDKTEILDIDGDWWLADQNGWNRYRYVNSSGTISTGRQSNTYGVRPVITLNTNNLYVDSGSGTSASPYTLRVGQ